MKVFLNTTLVLILSISGVVQSDVYITPSGTVQVNENNSVTLTCRYTGSRSLQLFKWLEFDTTKGSITPTCQHFGPLNTTKYSYNCSNDGKQVSWTVKTVDRSSNGATWRCDVVYSSDGKTENGNTVTISVRVPIKNVTMVKPASGDTITILENTAQEFRCRTDGGLPVAEIIWYKVNGTSSISTVGTLITNSGSATITTSSSTLSDGLITRTSSLTYRPTSVDNGMRIYCSASNVDNQDRIFSRQPLLKVLYQATGPFIDGYTNGGTYQVTENTTGSLTCRTFGGNPLPTLSWSCYSGSTSNGTTGTTVVKTRTWSATRDTDRMCTCTSEQQSLTGTQTVSVQVEILYPPSTPVLKVNSISVGNTVKVILNNNLRIQCSSSGKPIPSYTWTLPNNSQQHKEWLEVNDVQKPDKGRYTCRVTNNPGTEQVTKSSSTTVEVLYGPEITTLINRSAEEGESFSYRCPYTPGNPALTTVKWTRAKDSRTWNSELLDITTISKNDAMMYTCTVSNEMKPTNKDPVTDPKSGQFYLDVKYKATVTSFKVGQNSGSVTVDENMSPTLVCNVESNPVSNMTILFKNQTLTENANSLQLTHQISTVSCSNIGVYKCTGRNYLNAQTQSTKDIELFVKCSPQEYGETVATVYTALHNPSTLRLHLLAYPTIKSFTWTKLGTTDEILKNSTKVSMNISRVKVDGIYIDIFQLDLTLNNVSKSDLGTYKLFARNDQGTIERDFVLEPEDSPEQPTRLTHLEKYITTTKATIQWEPGFNGGPNQTFILLYKRMTDSEWNTIPVKESGESIMNYTLTGLQSDTKYEVKMYAQNRVGNSSTTSSIEIHTLAITENPTNIAPIIGGAVGGAAGLVVVIVIVVVFLRRYGPSKGKRGSDTELHRRSVSEDSDNDVMTENPSYVSSGAVAGFASGGASGGDNTYSQVQKKPKITVPAGNADVYAVVKKPNKKETKNKQKAKSSANDNQAGDVYENVQPKNGIQSSDNTYGNVGAQASSKKPKRNENQDGLIYVELDFDKQQNGKKPTIIIGDDDRTPYAEVDFTKKADPLPDSDEDNP